MSPSRGVSRRSFVRSAVAIGGASALAACLEREGNGDLDLPRSDVDPADLPERQHAWNDHVLEDEHGNALAPEHNVLLHLEYQGDEPTDDERGRLEDGFETLERAYERGSDGLAFTVGYGPAYFDRFEGELPDAAALPEPEALTPHEDPELDAYDGLIHLASNHASVVLSAEEALRGELEELNGRPVGGTLEGLFEVADRRTGFVGEGLPAENQEDVRGIPETEPVPDDAPLFMGFKSGFRKNQADEDRVTIAEGPFEGGTTTQLSHIRLHLEQWYEQDSRDQRVSKMFCPVHADEDRVEEAGHNMGDSSGLDDCQDTVEEDARTRGVVGHAQKAAREDGEPIILRRDFNSTDDGEAGVHFLSHQRSIADFVATRTAMTGSDLPVPRANSGIRQYVTVRRRANYLVPPRRHRSLPVPNPE
ncbi:DUF7405 family protein [Natrononativus amylolyticus]|uniref:DUF7405 family protein n=1 Tax=Natrononativus amylolyticus TaxID=2963434 RepID=UPI0020CB91CF|nr:Dyp-type peroxidase domain-containing protein [Natrononativus amylolyticus]